MTVTDNSSFDQAVESDAATTPNADGEQTQVWFMNANTVGRWFAVAIAVIVIVGTLANYALYNVAPHPDHPIGAVMKRFDLGHEPSIPAYYSATALLASGAFLAFLGQFDQTRGGTRRRYWNLLSVLFVCLAIDEAVMFHEMGDAFMERLNLNGPFYFSWVLPASVFVACIAIYILPFLMSLNKRTRTGLILSAVVFVSGAIGMELIAGVIFASAENELEAVSSVSHVIVQAIEEGLEMVGVAIFLCTLIDYAQQIGLRVDLRPLVSDQRTPKK